MVDILILNYNDADTTISLACKLDNYKCIEHILIVDNNSTDDSFSRISKIGLNKVEVIKTEHNGGYGYGNNFGIKYLYEKYNSQYILLCNPDVIIEESVVCELEKFLVKNNEYIIAAPYMCNNQKERLNETAFPITTCLKYILSFEVLISKLTKKKWSYNFSEINKEYIDVDAVSGCLFMFDCKKMIEDIMFDENVFLYCEERIIAMKIKEKAYKVALLPKFEFIHNHSVSINKTYKTEWKKRKIMNKSRMYVIKNYYHANCAMQIFAQIILKISQIENFLIEIIKK